MAALGLAVIPDRGIPPPLRGSRIATISVGEQQLRVAIAVDFARGLQGVRDLESLDGMLFELPSVQDPKGGSGWWMLGVPIPLEIAYFDPAGRLIEVERMDPCTSEPCPIYSADEPYRWVLETEVGTLRASPGAALRLNASP